MGSVTPKQGEGHKGGGGEGGAEHRLLGSVCVWGVHTLRCCLMGSVTPKQDEGCEGGGEGGAEHRLCGSVCVGGVHTLLQHATGGAAPWEV